MKRMSETFEMNEMITLSFNNDIHVSSGDLTVNCYLYAGKRLDEILRQIEKGLRELLESDALEGHISGLRHVITDKDIIMEMADFGVLSLRRISTFLNWEGKKTVYAYHLRIKLNKVRRNPPTLFKKGGKLACDASVRCVPRRLLQTRRLLQRRIPPKTNMKKEFFHVNQKAFSP
jgi:hypothetical protein